MMDEAGDWTQVEHPSGDSSREGLCVELFSGDSIGEGSAEICPDAVDQIPLQQFEEKMT